MPGGPQLYRIEPETRKSDRIEEVDFGSLGFREHPEWVADNPGILGDALISSAGSTAPTILLAVDSVGRLVIIELKRDDSGADAHWQAIKYASYLRRASSEDIARMAAAYRDETPEEGVDALLQHLSADDLTALNNDQRIILASHRFAPEVTSSALWLNEKSEDKNLVTCVTLTPYRDTQTGSLYVQATTIIPLPGIDDYIIGISDGRSNPAVSGGSNNLGLNLRQTFERNRNDDVTQFLRRVAQEATTGLPENIKPDKTSRWAGNAADRGCRYYHFWYNRGVWSNWRQSYWVHLYPQGEGGFFRAEVEFYQLRDDLASRRTGLSFTGEPIYDSSGVKVVVGTDGLTDDFGDRIAAALREFIEQITPIVETCERKATKPV